MVDLLRKTKEKRVDLRKQGPSSQREQNVQSQGSINTECRVHCFAPSSITALPVVLSALNLPELICFWHKSDKLGDLRTPILLEQP